jgi:hypothetical protein
MVITHGTDTMVESGLYLECLTFPCGADCHDRCYDTARI